MLVLVYCIYLVVNGALLMSEILTCCAVFYFILDFNHISPLITPKEVKIMLEQLKDRTSKKME